MDLDLGYTLVSFAFTLLNHCMKRAELTGGRARDGSSEDPTPLLDSHRHP